MKVLLFILTLGPTVYSFLFLILYPPILLFPSKGTK